MKGFRYRPRDRGTKRRLVVERLELRLSLSADSLSFDAVGELTLDQSPSIEQFVRNASLEILRQSQAEVITAINDGLLDHQVLLDRLQELSTGVSSATQNPTQDVPSPGQPSERHQPKGFESISSSIADLSVLADPQNAGIGDEFMVEVQIGISDALRSDPHHLISESSIYAAKVDLKFDPLVLEPIIDQRVVAEGYHSLPFDRVTDEGFVRDLSVVSSSSAPDAADSQGEGGERFTIIAIPFRVLGAGNRQVEVYPAATGEAVLLRGFDVPVPIEQIQVVPLTAEAPEDTESPDAQVPIAPEPIRVSGRDPRTVFQFVAMRSQPADKLSISSVWEDYQYALERLGDLDDDEAAEDEVDDAIEAGSEEQESDEEPATKTDGSATESKSLEESEEEAEETSSSFWQHFDFRLLEDQSLESKFKLHIRELDFRLQGNRARPKNADEMDATSQADLDAMDAGFADISVWLGTPIYSGRTPSPVVVTQPSNDFEGQESKLGIWIPMGKTVQMNRLELVEEWPRGVEVSEIELSDDGRQDVNPNVPESDAEGEVAQSEAVAAEKS